MTHPRAHTSFVRRAGQLAFALALVALASRVIQLAREPAPTFPIAPAAPGFAGGSIVAPSGHHAHTHPAANAELARLYTHCPLAAVVDLKTVATSPEQVDALLPPYRETADHVPAPPLEPAVPRIRYPVALRPGAAGTPIPSDTLRIASLPHDPASSPAAQDDWLIDPSEWYQPDDRDRLEKGAATPPTQPAAEPPAAAPNDPIHPPANGSWKLLTPDGIEVPAEAPQPTSIEPTEQTTPPANPTSTPTAPSESAPPTPPTAPLTPSDLTLPATEPASPAASPEPAAELQTAPIESEIQPPYPSEPFPAPSQSLPDDETLPTETAPTEPGMPAEPITPIEPAAETIPAPPTGAIFAPPTEAGTPAVAPAPTGGVDPHLELLAKNAYPSARECATCHEDIYQEWSVSAHAYAAVSPMFQKFEQKLNDLSQGTVGYFCVRCHAPVATDMCASRAEPLWNLPEVAREGVTCIACHRVQYIYGKSNGERRIEEGNVFAPVFGGIGGDGVAEAVHRKEHFKVKTSPDESGPGQPMHAAGIYFEPLTKSEFCTPCHQVQVHPGIKLEVVWEQYRASPACKKGIQCQDCHMGRVPGLPLGYDIGPVAKVADKTVSDDRKKSNHIFYGPNYPIAHPGIFPFHLKANRWTMQQWLMFDWRAGWGTDEFEDRVADGQLAATFPPCWSEADDRYDAREIIDDNLKKLDHKRDIREQVMENGSRVEGPFFDSQLCRGKDIHFHFIITNTNDGHNLLTASLGAQPQLWANVVLVGPDGQRLWETGYTDSFGDVANIHSHDVRHKKIPYDWQLFNLQTMFLITGAKGTDREFYVPVNVDIDQLPFIRPGVQPISVINHPPFIRMESQSLAPLGSRRVPYRIPGELIQQPGAYRLAFRLRNRAEPIYLMQFCGATEEMQRSMNEWMIDVHPISVEFTVP